LPAREGKRKMKSLGVFESRQRSTAISGGDLSATDRLGRLFGDLRFINVSHLLSLPNRCSVQCQKLPAGDAGSHTVMTPIGLCVEQSVGRERTVELISCDDVIHLPSAIGACSSCGSGLFAVIRTYLPDTGKAVETGIYVGCTNCDQEVGTEFLVKVRDWVRSNYRVRR
jgi:hypothetical protein